MNTVKEFMERMCAYWPMLFDLKLTPPSVDAYCERRYGKLIDAHSCKIEDWKELGGGEARCKVVFDVVVRAKDMGEDNVAKLLR